MKRRPLFLRKPRRVVPSPVSGLALFILESHKKWKDEHKLIDERWKKHARTMYGVWAVPNRPGASLDPL